MYIQMSVQNLSSHVIWKIETLIEEDTRYKKHCTQDSETSVPFKVGTLGPHRVLPVAISCPIVFSWISLWSEISSLPKVILVWGKARICRTPNLGLRRTGTEYTWVIWCFTKKLRTRRTWFMSGHVLVLQLPVTSCL